MFVKVHLVNFNNYGNWYYKRRFRLPPGELEEHGEHRCATTESEAMWGEDSPPYWEG